MPVLRDRLQSQDLRLQLLDPTSHSKLILVRKPTQSGTVSMVQHASQFASQSPSSTPASMYQTTFTTFFLILLHLSFQVVLFLAEGRGPCLAIHQSMSLNL